MGQVLRDGVSFCRIGEQLVFLDVLADRYFGLQAPEAAAFVALVDEAPLSPGHAVAIRSLIDRGLLLQTDENLRPLPMAIGETPATTLVDARAGQLHPVAVARALFARARAHSDIRRKGLARVLQALADAKTRIAAGQHDLAGVRRIAEAFQQASVLASAKDNCLPISLAVANALCVADVAPELVFAIKLRPFQAHCWVQIGSCVVNDRVDTVRAFTPILVV